MTFQTIERAGARLDFGSIFEQIQYTMTIACLIFCVPDTCFLFFPPEQESKFTLDFKTRSSQNVANHTIVFPETNKLTACAWFKTKEQGTIFHFLSTHNSTRNNFLVLVTTEGNLGFKFGLGAFQ